MVAVAQARENGVLCADVLRGLNLYLLIALITLTAVFLTFSQADAGQLFTYGSASEFSEFRLTNARWDDSAGGFVFDGTGAASASVESPEIATRLPFDHVIVSWNASTPPRAQLTAWLSVEVQGKWSGWYNMGIWNTGGCARPRTSVKDQNDHLARVETDTLVTAKPADRFRVRFDLTSENGTDYPALRFVAIDVNDTSPDPPADPETHSSVWGRELPVPQLCQLSVEGGSPWCSPTSTAMVLGYWSDKLHRPDLKVGITQMAHAVYDDAWSGTGNWVFNTAAAGEHKGIRAYVTRFDSVGDVEKWIAKGVPVIVSVDYNRLNRRDTTRTMGHLMVVRGFTRTGSPIINDPWAHLEKGETVRKIFPRADFERSWLGASGSHGTVYLVYPESLKAGEGN